MCFPYIIVKSYKKETMCIKDLVRVLIPSLTASVYFTILSAYVYFISINSEMIEARHNNLKNDNYRYVTTFESKREMQNYLKNIEHQRYSCEEGFRVTTNWYNEITLDSDSYAGGTIRHLFCLDESPHFNTVFRLNREVYEFAESFIEYPSNRLINHFCESEDAVVVDNNAVPVDAIDIMFTDSSSRPEEQVHLYCLNDSSGSFEKK